MKSTLQRVVAALIVTLALIGTAYAHQLPMNSIMNAFVKVESDRIDLVVRVPVDLLRGVPFPVRDSRYDVAASGPASEVALLLLEDGFVILEDGTALKPSASYGRLSAESDRSFGSYDSALSHVDGTSDPDIPIAYDKGYFDVHYTYPIRSPKSLFELQSQLGADLGSGAMLTLRYLTDDDTGRALIMRSGDDPAPLNPTWLQAARSFVLLGIDHILTGIDHLLFLFCLVIPFRRIRGLLSVITAFTLAHSVTLFASAFHLAPQGAWFPPFVEMAIAASIVYTAIENVVSPNLRRRWLVAGTFGLVHGFGFSNALGQSLQFAGSHLLLSLFSFNIGIEIGQLAVLAVMLPALMLVRVFVQERIGVVGLSAIGALTGAYWVVERWQALQDVQRAAAGPLWPFYGVILVATVLAATWVLAKRSRRQAGGISAQVRGAPHL